MAQATTAVECVVGAITGEKGTLGAYLKGHPELFPAALKKGLEVLWGYGCDEGARLARREPSLLREEAEFVVTACAAVCTLLTRKHSGDG